MTGSKTKNSTDWLNGYHQALLDAAQLVEEGQEEVNGDNSRRVRKRMKGNLMGLAYSDAIRAMKDTGL